MKFSDILILEGYDPEVVKIQITLKNIGKYNLGKSGKHHDGVDGWYGPLTDAAYKAEYGKSYKTINPDHKKITVDKSVSSPGAVLVGGLNYRPGDKSTSEQAAMLSSAIDLPVKGFDYNASNGTILAYMEANPGIPVFLFSAGCNKALALSKSASIDKNQLFIIEPYAASANVRAVVGGAVDNGVPASHVFVGGNASRGAGVVSGTSSSHAKSHWDAIASVGQMVK